MIRHPHADESAPRLLPPRSRAPRQLVHVSAIVPRVLAALFKTHVRPPSDRPSRRAPHR